MRFELNELEEEEYDDQSRENSPTKIQILSNADMKDHRTFVRCLSELLKEEAYDRKGLKSCWEDELKP